MDVDSRRELKVLEAIAENGHTTQRGLASHVGIALGLTNLYLKRLIHKGYVKCSTMPSNRVRYLITPKGIAQKTRLTFEFMEYSLSVFREGRNHLKRVLEPYATTPEARIALFGTGEAAELAYLCLRELALEPVAVFDANPHHARLFFGLQVLPIETSSEVTFDVLIVATFSDPSVLVEDLLMRGITREKMIMLREPPGARARPRQEVLR